MDCHLEWFGSSRINSSALGEKTVITLSQDLANCRRVLRERCPVVPGVYGWYDSHGQLIYVGKSKALRHRLTTYFAKQTNDPKMQRIRRNSTYLVWECLPHELLALVREQELIHRWRPEYNSLGQPTRRQPAFVCLSDSVAPHAYVARRSMAKSKLVFGPIMGSTGLQESVDALNHVFRMRDCSDNTGFQFGMQKTLFAEPPRAKCLRFELGSCPAPCANVCSSLDYREICQRAIAFLQGNDSETLKRLESQMIAASQRQHFERATVLRNQWQALKRLNRQLVHWRWTRVSIHGIFVCPLSKSRRLWAVFQKGCLVDTIFEPKSERQANLALRRLSNAEQSSPDPHSDILDINLQLIASSWFKKNPAELKKMLTFPEAMNICRRKSTHSRKSA